MWRGLRDRSDTYSFVLRASPTPFAHVLTLIYFGVGSRGERPWPLRPHLLQKGFGAAQTADVEELKRDLKLSSVPEVAFMETLEYVCSFWPPI